MKKIFGLLLSVVVPLTFVVSVQATNPLDDLLVKIQNERKHLSKDNQAREQRFLQNKQEQQALLVKAQQELAELEKESQRLQAQYESNEKQLTIIEEKLAIAVGSLGELFGVVRQVAGDFLGVVKNSITSAQIKDRDKLLVELSEAKSLPNIPQLESLWYQLQQEMTETGKVVRFETAVINGDGEKANQKLTRVGAFNLISGGSYFLFQGETGQVVELARQPSGRYLSLVEDFEDNSSEAFAPLAIDPSRGAILGMLVQAPSLMERIQQGGLVGYVILALLVVGLIVAIERVLTLTKNGKAIEQQMAQKEVLPGNPLGEIFRTYEENKSKDLETLELKLDESILKNSRPLTKGISTVKILSAVAPLLGLLGTVTGMIATFQSITLFGTGDPKLMAGGISQALVTTVLGLCCAIPLLLLHNVIASKSKYLLQILEEQSAGLLASRELKAKGTEA